MVEKRHDLGRKTYEREGNRMKESLWKQTYENILIGMGFIGITLNFLFLNQLLPAFEETGFEVKKDYNFKYRVSEVEARKSVVSDWLCRCGARGRDHDRLYRTWGSVGT